MSLWIISLSFFTHFYPFCSFFYQFLPILFFPFWSSKHFLNYFFCIWRVSLSHYLMYLIETNSPSFLSIPFLGIDSTILFLIGSKFLGLVFALFLFVCYRNVTLMHVSVDWGGCPVKNSLSLRGLLYVCRQMCEVFECLKF